MLKITPLLLAMLIIGALEAYAIYQGMNGVLLGGALAIIGGLGGYTTKALRK